MEGYITHIMDHLVWDMIWEERLQRISIHEAFLHLGFGGSGRRPPLIVYRVRKGALIRENLGPCYGSGDFRGLESDSACGRVRFGLAHNGEVVAVDTRI